MFSRTTTTMVLATALATLAGACGTNEFDRYRSNIDSAHITSLVTGAMELDVSDPAVVPPPGEESPADAAQRATESYIITSLRERLEAFADPGAMIDSIREVFAPEVSRGTNWRIAELRDSADLSVVATVDGYGMRIDALGQAELYFRMTMRAWYQPTGALVYEDWESHTVPVSFGERVLSPSSFSNDPAELAAERAFNLMRLNDLSGPRLRNMILDAADEAAVDAARELVGDVYR